MGGAGGSGRGKIQVTPRPNKTASSPVPDCPAGGEAGEFVSSGTEFPYQSPVGNLKAGI